MGVKKRKEGKKTEGKKSCPIVEACSYESTCKIKNIYWNCSLFRDHVKRISYEEV